MGSPSALNPVDRFLGAFNLFLVPVAVNCKVAPKTLLLTVWNDACHEGQKCVFVTTKGNHQLDKMCSRVLSQEVCGTVKTSLVGARSKDARTSFLSGASLKLGTDLFSLTSDRNLPTWLPSCEVHIDRVDPKYPVLRCKFVDSVRVETAQEWTNGLHLKTGVLNGSGGTRSLNIFILSVD